MTILVFILFFFILGLITRNRGDNLLDTFSTRAEVLCVTILIVLTISL